MEVKSSPLAAKGLGFREGLPCPLFWGRGSDVLRRALSGAFAKSWSWVLVLNPEVWKCLFPDAWEPQVGFEACLEKGKTMQNLRDSGPARLKL